ncbi:hypothetical protein PGS1_15510 [Enterobacter cloacae subsp. cloacae GS1]|nr:hypothetical protein PGS1_15510 [Enterobacter cloacae subsp. cloacae GS1]
MVVTRSFAIPAARRAIKSSRGGGKDNQIGPFPQLNVAHCGFGRRIEKAVGYRVSRDGLQAQWGDKGFAAFGDRDPYVGPALAQTAHQVWRFIGSNTAADAKNDFFTGPGSS